MFLFSSFLIYDFQIFETYVIKGIGITLCVHQLLSLVQLFARSWTIAYQAILLMEFSRQEYWSRLSFLLQRIFPTQELNLRLPQYRRYLYLVVFFPVLWDLKWYLLFISELLFCVFFFLDQLIQRSINFRTRNRASV